MDDTLDLFSGAIYVLLIVSILCALVGIGYGFYALSQKSRSASIETETVEVTEVSPVTNVDNNYTISITGDNNTVNINANSTHTTGSQVPADVATEPASQVALSPGPYDNLAKSGVHALVVTLLSAYLIIRLAFKHSAT